MAVSFQKPKGGYEVKNDHVLLKLVEFEKELGTSSIILMDDTKECNRKQLCEGYLVQVGPRAWIEEGGMEAVGFKLGDRVVIDQGQGEWLPPLKHEKPESTGYRKAFAVHVNLKVIE